MHNRPSAFAFIQSITVIHTRGNPGIHDCLQVIKQEDQFEFGNMKHTGSVLEIPHDIIQIVNCVSPENQSGYFTCHLGIVVSHLFGRKMPSGDFKLF